MTGAAAATAALLAKASEKLAARDHFRPRVAWFSAQKRSSRWTACSGGGGRQAARHRVRRSDPSCPGNGHSGEPEQAAAQSGYPKTGSCVFTRCAPAAAAAAAAPVRRRLFVFLFTSPPSLDCVSGRSVGGGGKGETLFFVSGSLLLRPLLQLGRTLIPGETLCVLRPVSLLFFFLRAHAHGCEAPLPAPR